MEPISHTDLNISIALLSQTLDTIEEKINNLKLDIKDLSIRVVAIETRALQWKGAFSVILGIGAILGTIASVLFNQIFH